MTVYGPWKTPTTTAFGQVTVLWSAERALLSESSVWTAARDGVDLLSTIGASAQWWNFVGQINPFRFQQAVYDLPLTPADLSPYVDPADAARTLPPGAYWDYETPAGTVLTHPRVKVHWNLASTRGPAAGPWPNVGTETFEVYQIVSSDPLASTMTWQDRPALLARSGDLINAAVVGASWVSELLLPHGVVDSTDVAHILIVNAANHAAIIPTSWTSDFGENLLFGGGLIPLYTLVEYRGPRYRLARNILPPLRQYPRDDELGGAPRQGKTSQSRSVQVSARQGWQNAYR